MYLFKWHSVGSDSCYSCQKWNGQIFSKLEDMPELPVHINCRCYIEVIKDQFINNHLEQIVYEIKSVHRLLVTSILAVNGYSITAWVGNDIVTALENLKDAMNQLFKTIEIFLKNYEDMKQANTKESDKYFHSKANAEAAQLGSAGEIGAHLISTGRELLDFWKYLLRDKMAIDEIIKDMNLDMQANRYGREVGRENPNWPAKDLVDIFRPRGLDKKY